MLVFQYLFIHLTSSTVSLPLMILQKFSMASHISLNQPKHIRVNAVCAGTIHTPLVDNLFEKFAQENHCSIDDYWRTENALYARGSAGRPEEVAEVVYFLASDASSFCTGGHYLVDGGLVAH